MKIFRIRVTLYGITVRIQDTPASNSTDGRRAVKGALVKRPALVGICVWLPIWICANNWREQPTASPVIQPPLSNHRVEAVKPRKNTHMCVVISLGHGMVSPSYESYPYLTCCDVRDETPREDRQCDIYLANQRSRFHWFLRWLIIVESAKTEKSVG